MLVEHPIVSIALCTFNGEAFLREQLDSIVGQTYPAVEIVICDDCSTDNTRAILDGYRSAYPHIRVYYNDSNLGHVKNFEKAILQCNGQMIALADQDDIWDKDKIAILVNNIHDNVLIYHDSIFIDEGGKYIRGKRMSSSVRMYDGTSCLPFIYGNCISGHSMMFKRTLVPFLLPLDSRFHHDWWIAYVAFNIGTVKYLSRPLVRYRQHQATVTDALHIRDIPDVKNSSRIPINLEWLEKCSLFPHNKEPALIRELFLHVTNIIKGEGSITRAFLFFLKHYDTIFFIPSLSPRGIFSKLNRIRKICSYKPNEG